MTKRELIKEALMLHVAKDGIRKNIATPFEQGDWVYATDGYTCIRISKAIAGDEYKRDYKCPDAEGVFNTTMEDFDNHLGTISDLAMPPAEDAKAIRLGHTYLKADKYERLRQTMLMLGLEGWDVGGYKEEGKLVIFMCGEVEVILMPYLAVRTDRKMPVVCNNARISADIDYEAGMAYFQSYKKAMEEKKLAEAEKKYNKIWSITIARYFTMYVEAKDLEEAKQIAEEHKDDPYDSDFEDPEIDSWENNPNEAEDYMDTIYTSDGEYSYDEYKELGEED